MENQTYPASKHALVYGAYVTVVLIVFSLAFYVFDLGGQTWTGYISYAVLLVGIVIASYHYRDNHMGGFITYGQSFMVGFLTALFAAIGISIFAYVFLSLMPPEYFADKLQQAEDIMIQKSPDITDDYLEMALDWIEKTMKPGFAFAISLIFNTLFGTIFSLLASIFIKREDNSMSVDS